MSEVRKVRVTVRNLTDGMKMSNASGRMLIPGALILCEAVF